MAGPDPAKFIENYGKQSEKSAIPMEDIFQPAQNQIELLKQKMENLTAQITDQREEILKETNELAKLGDEGGEKADKLARSITAGEGRLISLQQTLLQTQAKYDKAMSGSSTGDGEAQGSRFVPRRADQVNPEIRSLQRRKECQKRPWKSLFRHEAARIKIR